ncbi:MAG: hypothetical protein IBX69_03740 [Anaerolineales bacterium]|nr:hypothetical protein [Anaerolineales bacterium]
MGLPSIGPEKAFQVALEQLKMDMPKGYYISRVEGCQYVSFEEGVFTIGVFSEYNREWLEGRITSTLTRILTGIMNQTVGVHFIVLQAEVEEKENLGPEPPFKASHHQKQPSALTLQAEYQSIYDEIVQPAQVIVFPGYFLRYIPILGVELAWLYIGFRQAAYEAGAAKKPGKKFGAPAKKIARYSGMSPRSFWRWAGKPDTWRKLRWFVKPVKDEPRWRQGKDSRPHRSSSYYRVSMSIPLTPFDEISLRKWLYRQLGEGKNPIQVLQVALETSVDELIPFSEQLINNEDFSAETRSVQQLLDLICSPLLESDRDTFQELSNKLAHHLMPPKDLVFLTHYFVENWLPKLGPGPGWFVASMRDRCYLNRRTQDIRDEVKMNMGYAEIAMLLGLKRAKTVWEWLRGDTVSIFVREIGRDFGTWETAPRRFKVCLVEPMVPEHQRMANGNLSGVEIGANDTIRESMDKNFNGASDIDRENKSHDLLGVIGTINGANGTHNIGACDTSNGANDIDTPGAPGTFDWRDWRSLNTLSLGHQKQDNTFTTTPGSNGSKSQERTTKTVVGPNWNLEALFSRNRVSAKNRDYLLEEEVCAAAFISWLLYAASPGGKGIRDPVAHAISRLLENVRRGAGGSYDQLANLPANELSEMIDRALNWQSPSNADWRKVMEGSKQSSLQNLAEQLGLVVNSDEW